MPGWRLVLWSFGMGACSFSAADPGVVDAPRADAPQIDADDRAACQTPNAAGLVACFELEDGVADGTLRDSSQNRHDATTNDLTETMRGTSHAAVVTPNSMTYAPQASDLDVGAYTYAVWLRPETVPSGGVPQGVLDHELQYAFMLRAGNGNKIAGHCTHTGVLRTEYTADIPLAMWSLLACTWDGFTFTAYRWTSDASHERFSHNPIVKPAAAGANGLSIGHLSNNGAPQFPLDGAIDSVQLYNRAFTSDEVCALAGAPAGCLPCNLCE